jgi:hypothetical protein
MSKIASSGHAVRNLAGSQFFSTLRQLIFSRALIIIIHEEAKVVSS